MSHKGFSRVGLSALDLDKTHEFYEAFCGLISGRRPIHIKEGRRIQTGRPPQDPLDGNPPLVQGAS
jgi:hypothetical protein